MPKGGNMGEEKKAAKGEFTFHFFAVNLLEKLVEVCRGILTSKFLEFCIKWTTRIGHLGVIVAAFLGFIFTLIYAARNDRLSAFLTAIIWVLLVFVVQYTAKKFLNAGETLTQNNPTQLASQAFLDCFAFLALVGGVAWLILSIIQAFNMGFEVFLIGLGIFVFLVLLALLAFNPKEVTIKIVKSNSAGQEAIGIATFFIKAFMRLVPIFFGVLVVIFTIMMFIAGLKLFGDKLQLDFAWDICQRWGKLIIYAILLPFISYIIFAFFYLCIDVIKAILSIPEKLEKK